MWEITFTLNVSNIVLVIFKSFITICWGKNLDKKKKSHVKSQSQYLEKKSQLDYFPKSFSPSPNPPSPFPSLLSHPPTHQPLPQECTLPHCAHITTVSCDKPVVPLTASTGHQW